MRLVVLLALLLAASTGSSVDLVNPADATLRDVEFIDPLQGWAVGDQGTAWYTVDGGRLVEGNSSWLLRAMPTQAMLTSIDMKPVELMTSRRSLPFSRGSTGQILVTADVGRKWQPSRTPTGLAGIQKVWLAETGLLGYAIGEASDAHPSGIAVTTNGGRTWEPLAERATAGWTASYCINDENLLLGDLEGRITILKSGQFSQAELRQPARSAIRSFTSGRGRIWAVGDKCLVLKSADGGTHWESVEVPVPSEAARVWNLGSVAAIGSHIWAVGRPGSVVLHSADAGDTWELQPTNSAAPLSAVYFLDETHGWAVGAMGTILATTDSGRTWQIQRRADERAGILWVAADHASVSLASVAMLCGDMGYRGVATAMTSLPSDDRYPGSAARPERFAEAFRAVGGMCAETSARFPMLPPETAPTSESVLKEWQSLYGDASEEIRREMVLSLRIWQPRIVITDERPASPNDPVPRALVDTLCREACRESSDKEIFREQLDVLRLSVCEEPMLLVMQSTPSQQSLPVLPDQTPNRLGEEFGVVEAIASARLSEGHIIPPEPVYLANAQSQTSTTALLDAVAPGSPGRRLLGTQNVAMSPPPGGPIDLASVARNWPRDPNSQFERLQAMVQATGESKAGVLLYDLGAELWKLGRAQDAKGVHDFLVVHLPEHPYAVPVYRQLMAYHTSREIVSADDAAEEVRKRLTKTLAYSAKLQDDGSFLLREPATALALASAGRRLDRRDILRGYLAMMLTLPKNHAARSVVDLEMWAIDRSARPDRRIVRAAPAGEPPYLDGQLDDPCWREGRSATLDGSSIELAGRFRTEIQVRYDEEYLYVAADCAYPDPSFRAEPAARTGPDADLASHDRLVLAIDVDRDYVSFLELAVDSRGLLADQKVGDFDWNPKWFVATTSDERGWRVEMAVPLAELPVEADVSKQVWAFNVLRIIPGHAVLSLTGPTSAEIRGVDCTLLTFGNHAPGKSAPLRGN